MVQIPELARDIPGDIPGDLPGDLHEALTAARFTYDEVADVLGPVAHAALSRNETTPGVPRHSGRHPVETLTRLWLLQARVPAPAAEAALPGLVDRLCAAGILERSVDEVAARVDVRPYGTDQVAGGGNLWVASDLTPGLDGAPNAVGSDHVLGISSAVHVAGPADRARPGRPRARPRHRLRRPGPAPRRAHRATSSPPTSTRARSG